MREQIETLMKLLVGTDTTNPPGRESSLAEKLLLYADGCSYERIPYEKDRESLIITVRGENPEYTLCFAGHLDTVPVGNLKLWKHNPFGEIAGDIMYGRGTTDMCGGLAAMLLLLTHYRRNMPPVTVKLLFTADEEAGGAGARTALEQGYLKKVNGLILCEPSNLALGISEKGALWLRITVRGVSCHASMPAEGKNALQTGMSFVNGIKHRIEPLSAGHPLLGNNTCEITGCRSGVKINILPEEAVFEADIRTLPSITGGNAAILQIIDEIRREYETGYGVSIKTEILGNREAIEEPEGSEFIRRIKKAAGDMGYCREMGVNFFTDGSVIIPGTKIPFAILGPGDPKQCHTIDEYIELEQIEQCFYLYKKLIESYR